MIYPLVAVAIAFLCSLVITPLARQLALRIGMVDHPDSHRKLHREPIALCGGTTILFSLFATVAVFLIGAKEYYGIFQERFYEAVSLAIGAIAIVLLGASSLFVYQSLPSALRLIHSDFWAFTPILDCLLFR